MTTTILKAGDKAPDFEAHTQDQTLIRLSQYEGQLVWLIFYRYAKCPLCNLHLNAVIRRKALLEQCRVQPIAVFESHPKQFPKEPGKSVAPGIPLIADPTKVLYELYGVESKTSAAFAPQVAKEFFKAIFSGYPQGKIEGDLGQLPAHFLIAEDGVIETVYYGKNIADHLPWTVLDEFVKSRSTSDWHRRQA